MERDSSIAPQLSDDVTFVSTGSVPSGRKESGVFRSNLILFMYQKSWEQ
jgi:hypothetical protein